MQLRLQPKSASGDLASLDAGRADVQTHGCTIHDGAHLLDVRIPPTDGLLLGPRDVVPEARVLLADVTHGSHDALLDWKRSSSWPRHKRASGNPNMLADLIL